MKKSLILVTARAIDAEAREASARAQVRSGARLLWCLAAGVARPQGVRVSAVQRRGASAAARRRRCHRDALEETLALRAAAAGRARRREVAPARLVPAQRGRRPGGRRRLGRLGRRRPQERQVTSADCSSSETNHLFFKIHLSAAAQ